MSGAAMTPEEARAILMPRLLGNADTRSKCPSGELHEFNSTYDGKGGQRYTKCRYYIDALGNEDFKEMSYQ